METPSEELPRSRMRTSSVRSLRERVSAPWLRSSPRRTLPRRLPPTGRTSPRASSRDSYDQAQYGAQTNPQPQYGAAGGAQGWPPGRSAVAVRGSGHSTGRVGWPAVWVLRSSSARSQYGVQPVPERSVVTGDRQSKRTARARHLRADWHGCQLRPVDRVDDAALASFYGASFTMRSPRSLRVLPHLPHADRCRPGWRILITNQKWAFLSSGIVAILVALPGVFQVLGVLGSATLRFRGHYLPVRLARPWCFRRRPAPRAEEREGCTGRHPESLLAVLSCAGHP